MRRPFTGRAQERCIRVEDAGAVFEERFALIECADAACPDVLAELEQLIASARQRAGLDG
jgi:hypothetical protein